MVGWAGVALCAAALGAALLMEPGSLPLVAHAEPELVFVAALLAAAALGAILGLLSPPWSIARQAAMWTAVAAAGVTIGTHHGGIFPAAQTVEQEPVVRVASARTVEIKAGAHGHFVTSAEIDNTPVTVLVDTGATKVALSYEDAERIGLKPFALDYEVPVSTANGTAKGALVTLSKVEIDNLVVRDVEAIVMPKGVLAGTLLGMSFLSKLSLFRIADDTLYLKE